MADFKINTDRLNSESGNVRDRISGIRKRQNNLVNYLSQLDSMWDGPSSEAFKKSYNDDLKALTTMISNLDKLYQYEQKAKDKYNSCERKVIDMVSGL